MSKYIKVDDLQRFCDNQKDHSITPNDFQRMNHYDFGWHTGTPTEEGLYAVYYYADGEYDYGFADWNGGFWDEHFSYDSVGCRFIAWQKIEPYEG